MNQWYAAVVVDADKANAAYPSAGGLVLGDLRSVASQDDSDPIEVASWERGIAPTAFLEAAGLEAVALDSEPGPGDRWDVDARGFVPVDTEFQVGELDRQIAELEAARARIAPEA